MNESEGLAPPVEVREKPKKVFLEVGLKGGIFAGPVLLDKNFKHDQNQLYIGVDIDESIAGEAKQAIENLELENAEILIADGKKLPFQDHSIDTIYLGNVFGSTGTYEINRQMLREAKRVLNDQGRIVVLETVTPRYAEEAMLFEDQLEAAGFDEIKKIKGDDPNWASTLAEFGTSDKTKIHDHLDELLKSDRFLILAKPKQEK